MPWYGTVGMVLMVSTLVLGILNLELAFTRTPLWVIKLLAGFQISFAAVGGPLLGAGLGIYIAHL